MPLYPIFFLFVVIFGWIAGLTAGPLWALLTYVFVYFNIPSQFWWGDYVPDLRWGLISAGFLVASCALFRERLAPWKLFAVSPFVWLMALLLLMAAVSMVSPFASASWSRTYDFFRYVVIFGLIIKVLADTKSLNLAVKFLILETAYLAYLAHDRFRGGRLDGFGLADATDANTFASLLIGVIPLLATYCMYGKRWEKLLSLPILAGVMNAFIYCKTRGGFLALLGAFLFLIPPGTIVRNKRLLAAVCIGVAVFAWLADPDYLNRLKTLSDPTQHSSGRVEIWGYGLQMFFDRPLGWGGKAFEILSPAYIPEALLTDGRRVAHNTFLQVLVEQGVVGFVLYCGFLFSVYRLVTGVRKSNDEIPGSGLTLGVLAVALRSSFVGIVLSALFLDRLYAEYVYFYAALCVCVNLIYRTKEKVSKAFENNSMKPQKLKG